MTKIRKIGNSLLFIMLLPALWFLFTTSRYLIQEIPSCNDDYIPENALIVARIDGKMISENTLFSVLMESKDEEISQLMQDFLNSRGADDQKLKDPGIHLLSDLFYVQIPVKDEKVNCILVNLTSKDKFLDQPKGDSKTVRVANDEIGLIMMRAEGSKLDRKTLIALGNKIIRSKSTESFRSNKEDFTQISWRERSSQPFSDFAIRESDDQLIFSGSFQFDEKASGSFPKQVLKPQGFHVCSNLMDNAISDTLTWMLNGIGIELPPFESFSLNYYGAKVINHSTGFFVVPQIDLIMKFEENVSIKELFEDEELKTMLDYKQDKGSIWFQKEQLHFKQLSPTTIFLGVHENPQLIAPEPDELISIYGELEPLMNVEGGGLMTAFLEMIPAFKAGKRLSAHSKEIDIRLTRISKGEGSIEGNLKFEKGCYPMSEAMRFVLINNFFSSQD
jgi:hypothetical protein